MEEAGPGQVTIGALGGYYSPMRANYHTHSTFCDGQSSAAEMAEAAFAAGYKSLGFSSHAPLPFDTGWTMRPARLPEYVSEIRGLAATWKGRMEIELGLEIDWIEGVSSPGLPLFEDLGLDYRICSVHFVKPGPEEAFTVDCPAPEFEAMMAERAGGDGRLLYRTYYDNLARAIDEGGFDILGHLDLVRRNNRDSRWFDPESRDYLDTAFAAIEALGESGAIVEINIGGMLRGGAKSPYPSLPILRRLRELRVPITISSDAHHVSQLGVGLEIARDHARAAGYREVAVRAKGNWGLVGIDET